MHVELSARKIAMPRTCGCCAREADSTLTVTARRLKSPEAQKLESRSMAFPYCTACQRHVRAYEQGNLQVLLGVTAAAALAAGILIHWIAAIPVALVLGALAVWHRGSRRRAARHLMVPGCASPARTVFYLGWHGARHRFELVDKRFAKAFAQLNSEKLVDAPPELTAPREEDERHVLSRLVVEEKPIPPDLALTWLALCGIELRTPATRCPDEYTALFRRRYERAFGAGFVVRPPSGPPLDNVAGTVDVTQLVIRAEPVRALADSCADDLDSYSRWLGRNARRRGTIPAAALLPAEILQACGGDAVRELQRFLVERLSPGPTLVDGKHLVSFWPSATPGTLTRVEARLFVELLAKLEAGVEPDVRTGGPALGASSPAVLFRGGALPSPAYAASALLLHLGAQVSAGSRVLDRHAEAGPDAARLVAHLMWLRAARPGLGRIRRRISDVSPENRATLGEFLVGVAAGDGVIGAEDIATLGRLYEVLGLDPDEVPRHVHALETGGTAPSGGVTLDMDRVREKLADSKRVSEILGEIFVEEEEVAPEQTGKLDAKHQALAAELAKKPRWTRAEIAAAAKALGLLPDGAVELINETAIEEAGGPALEGDDPVDVNLQMLKEIS
jgi:hypothetical protein